MPPRIKRIYRWTLAIGLILVLSPLLFLWVVSLVNWAIFPSGVIALLLIMLLLAAPLVFLGALWLIALGIAYGAHALIRPSDMGSGERALAMGTGAVCAAVSLYLIHVPDSPDSCSRALSDTGYEICLEKKFASMSVPETRQWLADNGYRIGKSTPASNTLPARDPRHRDDFGYSPDFRFPAIRDNGPLEGVPYGMNLNRIWTRFGLSMDRFELNLYGESDTDTIVSVDVWWGREFL